MTILRGSTRLFVKLALAVAAVLFVLVGLQLRQGNHAYSLVTREVLGGVRVTLKDVKRVSHDKIQIVLSVQDRRRDRSAAELGAFGFLTVEKPRGEEVGYRCVRSADPDYRRFTLDPVFRVPPGTRRVTVTYYIDLHPKNSHIEFSFRSLTPRSLPVVQKKRGIEMRLLRILANPTINRASWQSETKYGSWIPSRGKYFAVLVESRFPSSFHGWTGFAYLKDDLGREYERVAEYVNNSTRERDVDALVEGLMCYTEPTRTEKAVGKASPAAAERIARWRADGAVKETFSKSMPPELCLHVFAADKPPNRFSIGMTVEKEPDPGDEAIVTFEGIPVW